MTGGLIVELQRAAGGERLRATGGTVQFDKVEPGDRYSGSLNLHFPNGRLSGTFEVVPRPEPED